MISNLQLRFRDYSSILTSFSADFHSAIRVPQSAFIDPVARPSNSRSLRSAQSRTASGICDKRVPSCVASRQQFMKYPG
jgi:hypothetical protein